MNIHYVEGDATAPVARPACIVHCCNDIGGWGAGFVLAVSRRWPHVEQRYRTLPVKMGLPLELGYVQVVPAELGITVFNLIGQRGIGPDKKGDPPIRYEAIDAGLGKIGRIIRSRNVWSGPDGPTSLHLPRMGCGLAGGSWARIEESLEKHLKEVDVYVYDFPGGHYNP
jgi:O-acetyl-ADP-ribose deacetylase (regulator of RNase III)